jgi:hypothetical protein
MSRHRYRRASLRGDFIRAGTGLLLCGISLYAVRDHDVARWIFLVLVAFFILFALRTLMRQVTEFELTPDGIRRSIAAGGASGKGFSKTLSWNSLDRVRLKYYSTRRDRSDGWMHLVMRTAEGRLSVDSTVDQFGQIAHAAARAAVVNRVDMSGATMSNFAALDVRLDRLRAAEEAEETAVATDTATDQGPNDRSDPN